MVVVFALSRIREGICAAQIKKEVKKHYKRTLPSSWSSWHGVFIVFINRPSLSKKHDLNQNKIPQNWVLCSPSSSWGWTSLAGTCCLTAERGVTYQIKIIGGPKQIFQVAPDCVLPDLNNKNGQCRKKKKGQRRRLKPTACLYKYQRCAQAKRVENSNNISTV